MHYPKLKVLTHHCGGMIPFFHRRVEFSWDLHETRMGYQADGQTLTKAPLDFFSEDHMLFGTDSPYDSRMGENVYRETIAAVDAMVISADTRQKIYVDNARKLFRLPK